MLKPFLIAVTFATAISASSASFAQSSQPVTRAQVKAELAALEQVGWRPSMGMGSSPAYPEGILAAEAKVAAQKESASGYNAAGGTSETGHRVVSTAEADATQGHQ
ncbi:DUF4148 domain-containing protein [Paraburkholderia sp. DHOC27]|uniref:DUF4148 domain-containing protein n=1 Tax=Paraburkholderia sp. DHOC27 TaxID=2303330 RepID=UPI000E3CB880|nr:DUF4148 domain-containing protein [Paraburkholderia sp. DHOC27]RFU49123.1 DUF4148 domain-containing protein [Paraburkholderia sp. DHOC27]